MLSRDQQQTNNNSFSLNIESNRSQHSATRLTLSYDLNNYQPLLKHLQVSDDRRWILFIAPPGKPNFHLLQQAGIDKNRIITLTQKQLTAPEKVFKDALASNNYAAVVHWANQSNERFIDEINQLTAESNTHCFVYCAQ